jgi:hypothetical protein
MIQLRSSRTTRNQDGAARRGANDFDPTEGLPVRKYQFATVRVNQDANDEPLDGGREDQNKDENLFSKELPLPSFFKQLPELNQVFHAPQSSFSHVTSGFYVQMLIDE